MLANERTDAEQAEQAEVENSELPITSEEEFGISRILQLRNRRVPVSEKGRADRGTWSTMTKLADRPSGSAPSKRSRPTCHVS